MIKLFGHRALLDWWKPESGMRIIQPDNTGQQDVLKWGKVSAVGDGKLTWSMREQIAGRGFASPEKIPSLVSLGDRVCFELNTMIERSQVYRKWQTGMDAIQMLQTDLIGRLKADVVSLENFEILGDFVLVKPVVRNSRTSLLVLPDSAQKNTEFVYYTVVQKGSTVDLPIKVGQEIIINHGRINALFFSTVNQITGTATNDEYGYVIKDYIHGVVDES